MKTSESKIRANTRYNKKAYDQLAIRLPKGERERFAAYAEGKGLSLAEYVRRACYEFSGEGLPIRCVCGMECKRLWRLDRRREDR